MSLELKGINNLIKKLDNLATIDTKDIVEEVAKDVEEAIIGRAKKFSDTEYLYIKKMDTRKYGNSTFIDVGLKNDEVDFDLWKGLWYQHWGYENKGLNFSGQFRVTNNILWFDEAINECQDDIKRKLRSKLKAKVNKALR